MSLGRHDVRTELEPFTQIGVEQFLYAEAALLDEWKLDEWLLLFTEDMRYVVPTPDLPDGDPRQDLVLIDDDYIRLQGRVRRLRSRFAHREQPHSRTRRIVSNVRIVKVENGEATVEACFVIYRFKNGSTEPYVGQYLYRLTREPEGLKIRYRRATLDLETLRGQGAVSIIL
jgi:p-cumate 2,3-dioxygenase subunit beta